MPSITPKAPQHADPYIIAKRAARFILFLNFILFTAKAIAGWFGHSYALFADGLNNLTDVGISFTLFLALRFASKPPDAEHAYGHGKIETEIARVVGVFVLATAGGIIVGGFQKLGDQHPTPTLWVIIVATFSILVKEYMYRFLRKIANRISSRALEADALNHRTDVAATSCVLIGSLIVKIGGAELSAIDDIVAILVGIIMAYAASRVVLSSTQDMLDIMPPDDIIRRIRNVVKTVPGVCDTEKILGRKMGMFYNIDIHIEVNPALSVYDAHAIGHQAKEFVKNSIPEIGDILVHIEPHLADTPGHGQAKIR